MGTAFLDFARLIAGGQLDEISTRLSAFPALATGAFLDETFLSNILHHIYKGDTALHVAAAAFRQPVAALLVEKGADWRARNRRGAQPLHYAADANRWDPEAQAEIVRYLIAIGADANSLDASGVAPLHRAVRTRSLPAVRALVDGGADALLPNGSGSTPLHLAVQSTGRGGSGTVRSREQQAGIIRLLLDHGARPTDRNSHGTTVLQAATSAWIRDLLTAT